VGTNVEEEIWASRIKRCRKRSFRTMGGKTYKLIFIVLKNKKFPKSIGSTISTTPQNCSLALTCNDKNNIVDEDVNTHGFEENEIIHPICTLCTSVDGIEFDFKKNICGCLKDILK
jgi:hypothetical protein